jgi:hypothetical protein
MKLVAARRNNEKILERRIRNPFKKEVKIGPFRKDVLALRRRCQDEVDAITDGKCSVQEE